MYQKDILMTARSELQVRDEQPRGDNLSALVALIVSGQNLCIHIRAVER